MSEWGGNDRGPTLNAVTWGLTGVSIATVALRFVSRTCFGGNKLGLDDYFTLVCILIMLASGISISLAVESGVGKHIGALTLPEISEATKRTIIMNFFIVWTFSMPKFAIIALLRRILRLSKPVEYTFWGIATVNQAGILATAILWFARCQPAAKAWDPTLPGTCGTLEVLGDLGYVTSALSAALDIFFALYPIPFIMKLNMSLRRRISTSISLGLGSIACVVSIYKITTFPSSIVELSVDPTFAVVPIVLFANIEANILILSASLATLGPIFRWVVGNSPLTKHSKNSSTGANSRGGPWRNRNMYKLNDAESQDQTTSRNDWIPLVKSQGNTEVNSAVPQTQGLDEAGIRKQVQISVTYE